MGKAPPFIRTLGVIHGAGGGLSSTELLPRLWASKACFPEIAGREHTGGPARGGGPMRIPAFVALLVLASAAQSQPWPSKPVCVVIPWPPGQATDIATRLVGQRLQEVLGQPFVMDNKPGAGGAIGTDTVAKAAPDGYTLLGCSSGPMSVLPAVQKTSYDPLRDFVPLAITNASGYVLVTSASFPAANAKQLVALLRANPGKYSFSSSGAGATPHL